MQIRIEIDVKPEELRRFLGLPDVAGLQEDVIQFLRDKVGSASENFDPATFVKDNLQTLRRSAAWLKVLAAGKIGRPADTDKTPPAAKSTSVRKPRARKAAVKAAKKAAGTAPEAGGDKT